MRIDTFEKHPGLVVITIDKKEVASILIQIAALVGEISLPYRSPELFSADGQTRYVFTLPTLDDDR